MCFFSAIKQVAPTPVTAPPSPTPLPTPADANPSATQDQKRLQIANLKKGFASTIVNSGGAQGLTGKGADLSAQSAQASAVYPNKTTVGS